MNEDNKRYIEPDLASQLTPEPDADNGEGHGYEEADFTDTSYAEDPYSEPVAYDTSESDLTYEADQEMASQEEQDEWQQEMTTADEAVLEPEVVVAAPVGQEMPGGLPLQDRMIPRISIDAFCDDSDSGVVMQRVAADRRLNRAHVNIQMGGVEAALETYATASTPDLVLIEMFGERDKVLGDIDRLAEVCDAGTKVVVIGKINDIILYRELVQRGVSEYLVGPITVAQVIDTMSGLYADPDMAPIGRSIVFTGAKGGVGSSTLAHNVAWCVSERMKHDVTLIDLDLPFGTAGLDFNEDPTQGVAEALMDPERLDDQLLDRLLVKCSEHLSLFASPSSLERTYVMDTEAFDSILDTVRATVPCMIVDLPHIWEPWSRHILSTADEIVITATPDLASLRNTKNLMETLVQARQNDARPKLVINQLGIPKRPEIPAKDFAEAIGAEVDLILPFDPQLFGTAANNGQMIGEVKPESKAAQGFVDLAQRLTNREVAVKKQAGVTKFWSQLVGK
ncbi:MAG: CtpF protein [Alphaproteobacteria bacterium]|nr:MAG: CtpF protein [Alphaproteobacteria bacterium]